MLSAKDFLESLGGDPEVCVEILMIALQECEAQIAEVTALQPGADADSARRALHSLRGASSTFGATSFVALMRRMETDCNAGNLDNVLGELENFRRSSARYREELRAMLDELRAMP